MNRKARILSFAATLAVALLALAGAVIVMHGRRLANDGQATRSGPASARLAVPGGDGGGLPLADPGLEHLDAAALARAAQDPAAAGLEAFLVTRHGHLVFARYGPGFDAKRVIDAGGFARVLPALLAGIAVQDGVLPTAGLADMDAPHLRAAIERATRQRYVDYLSQRLWSRLNAATAWIDLPSAGAAPPIDCCLEARIEDWLRVGGLLANDGSFEDTPVLQPGWIARMHELAPLHSGPGSGAQPSDPHGFGIELPSPRSRTYQAGDVFLLRGPGHWRLWAIPSLKLVVLFGARGSDGTWDETRLPNLVIEALRDQSPTPRSDALLQQLVPGH